MRALSMRDVVPRNYAGKFLVPALQSALLSNQAKIDKANNGDKQFHERAGYSQMPSGSVHWKAKVQQMSTESEFHSQSFRVAGCSFRATLSADKDEETELISPCLSLQLRHNGPLMLALCCRFFAKKVANSEWVMVAEETHTLTAPDGMQPSLRHSDPFELSLEQFLSAEHCAYVSKTGKVELYCKVTLTKDVWW